jgi:glycosyltransferase involved in cell wall biosynthesis
LAWRTAFICELLSETRSAVLVEPGNIRALREGLCALIASPGYRLQIGDVARREVLETFGVPVFVRRLTGVYEELLGGG